MILDKIDLVTLTLNLFKSDVYLSHFELISLDLSLRLITKMGLTTTHTPPTHPPTTTNFLKGSRLHRRLQFGILASPRLRN